jgi:predicted outer membrane repeat protein
MHLKILRAAATVALLGGTATLGLGSTQAALADPTPTTTLVDCSTTDLIYAMNNYTSGDTLVLTPDCTYWVTNTTGPLPTVMHTLTIVGHDSTFIERSHTEGTDPFSIFTVGCTNGNLTLVDVNVSNGGGTAIDGGAINIDPGTVTVKGGTFSDNNAPDGYGGAIDNDEGTLTVQGATFTGNSSEWGGAIYSENGVAEATLSADNFFDNSATYGGAVYNDDNDMTISADNFRYNTATDDGGAIYNDYWLVIAHSAMGQNSAEYGGGVYNSDDETTLTIANSALTLNQATDDGGGLYNDEGDVTLSHDTISFNTPDNCDPDLTGCRG